MRNSLTRSCLVAVLAVSFSGCYSGGRWTMPNLAFWQSSPFDSVASSDESPDDMPKPSELASEPGPEPGAGYESGAVDTAMPDYPSTAGTTDAPAYTATTPAAYTAQQPYPSSSAPGGTPQAGGYGPGGGYVPPQQGQYSSAPPAAAGGRQAYGAADPYASAGPSGYDAQPQPRYGAQPGYGTQHDYASSPAGYGSPQGYGGVPAMPDGADSGYNGGNDSRYDSGRDRYATAPSAGAYGNPVREQAPPSDSGYQPAQTADYRNGATYDYRRENDWRGDGRDSGNWDRSGDRYAQPPAGQPSAAQPGRDAGTDHGRYEPPVSDYHPGDTGYNPAGTPPYQSPSGAWNAPSSSDPNEDDGYRPGSVKRYQPQSSEQDGSHSQPGALSREARVDTSIVPVSYGAPMRR